MQDLVTYRAHVGGPGSQVLVVQAVEPSTGGVEDGGPRVRRGAPTVDALAHLLEQLGVVQQHEVRVEHFGF